jgi:hypothetical protein
MGSGVVQRNRTRGGCGRRARQSIDQILQEVGVLENEDQVHDRDDRADDTEDDSGRGETGSLGPTAGLFDAGAGFAGKDECHRAEDDSEISGTRERDDSDDEGGDRKSVGLRAGPRRGDRLALKGERVRGNERWRVRGDERWRGWRKGRRRRRG